MGKLLNKASLKRFATSLSKKGSPQLAALVIITSSIITASCFVVFQIDEQKGLETAEEFDILYACPGDPRCKEENYETDQDMVRIQATNCTISDGEIAINSVEREFLMLINNYRSENNLGTLGLSENLSRAAAWHSKDMAARAVLSHTDSLGRDPSERIPDCDGTNYVGENVAYNTIGTAAKVFDQWKNSPGHNENMLRSTAKSIGIGLAYSNSRYYWTTAFGGSTENWDGGTPTDEPTATSAPPTATPTTTGTPQATATVTDTPTATGTITPTIDLGLIKWAVFTVKIPGIGKGAFENQNPQVPLLGTGVTAAAAEFFSDTNTLALRAEGLCAYKTQTGLYECNITLLNPSTQEPLPDGNYSVKLSVLGSLKKAVASEVNIQGDKTTVPGTIEVTMGDANGDNFLDLKDYNEILNCYRKDCVKKNVVDFNDDGIVDEKDLNIFYSSLAKRAGD